MAEETGRSFCIAHADVLRIICIQEDTEFLLDQREKENPGKILSIRKIVLTKKEFEAEKIKAHVKRMQVQERGGDY